MASRFALKSLRSSALARPTVAIPRTIAAQSSRLYASQPTPDEKAASIINSVPSTSLFTKTGGVVLGTGLTAAAISSELYVANEETVLAVGFFIILFAVGRSIGAPYTSWAESHIERIKGILNASRTEHTRAVTERIDSVHQLKEVVPLTEQLYAVAKETNELEHANFLLAQDSAIKSELKSVLDSWVRYEQQQREAEQIALIKTVKENVDAELAKPAFKKQLLEEALAQIEQLSKSKAI
ncbi:F-type H+-transporting ATPase subunit b, partial [Tremellales sp. Uapishka_1]